MPPRNPLRAAFTLVEMAIVIVIIGLLVGGIFAGQSYVRSSQLATLMTEAKYYINAAGQFQVPYKAFPGDMSDASTRWNTTHNGNGDGAVNGGLNAQESFYAFEHLALAGFIPGRYSGAGSPSGTSAVPGVNMPVGPIQNVTYYFDHPSVSSYPDGTVSGDSVFMDGVYTTNVLRIGAVSSPSTGLPTGVFLTPTEALEIDRKFDDGLPATGWITAQKYSAFSFPNCTDSGNAGYKTSYGNKGCNLILKIQ